MANLRISDAQLLTQDKITGAIKVPTGGVGNYSIQLSDLAWYVVNKENLTDVVYVDTAVGNVNSVLQTHVADKANPHQVTKEQVGLGNVDNTADLDKPVSNAVNSAIITAVSDKATISFVNERDALKADITYVDTKVGVVSGGYFGAYETLANLKAVTGMTTGQIAKVMNDSTATNNGDYRYTGSAWVKGYDALTDAKTYTDNVANTKANIASPVFTGTPTAPTASISTNNTQIANTAFVTTALTKQLNKSLTNASITLTTDEALLPILSFSGALTADVTVTVPTMPTAKVWTIRNSTTGGYKVTLNQGGTNVVLPSGLSQVYTNTASLVAISAYTDSALKALDSLKINQGKNYPSRQLTRNGVTSNSNLLLTDAILDVRVTGARDGYYYGIRYFKNGTTALPGYQDGWMFEEIAIADWATSASVSTANTVVTYTDYAPDIVRDGSIQTVKIDSPKRAGLSFYITLDASKLANFGTFYKMLTSSDVGFSWIIDPSRYTYAQASTVATIKNIYYSVDSNGKASMAWLSGNTWIKLWFGKNGANNLPNIIGIDTSTSADYETATWTTINSAATDWLPPVIVEAVNNGDGNTTADFTGGNHLNNGAMTARNVLYQILIDDKPLDFSSLKSGICNRVTFVVVNELMAYNTVSLNRYVLRQSFRCDVIAGAMSVSANNKALEDIKVQRDYAIQMVTNGYQDTQLMLDGQQQTRIAFDQTLNSGAKSAYPNAWALILQDDINGQMTSWIDRAYADGDGKYIADTEPLIRSGGKTTKKYHAVVYDSANPRLFAANTGYKYRGGYAWQAASAQPSNFDSVANIYDGAQRKSVIVTDASHYTIV